MAKFTGTAKYISESSGIDKNQDTTYTRIYHVSTDVDPTTSSGGYRILQGEVTGLPKHGDRHPDDQGTLVTDIKADWSVGDNYSVKGMESDHANNERLGKWQVTVTYTKATEPAFIWGSSGKPWERGCYNVNTAPISYNMNLEKAWDKDSTWLDEPTVPIENTVGDKLAFETVQNNTLLTFDCDLREYDAEWELRYVGSCNKDSLQIAGFKIGAEKAKLKKVRTRAKVTSTGTQYYTFSVEIELALQIPVRYKTLLNAGYNVLRADDTSISVPIFQRDNGVYEYATDASFVPSEDASKISEPIAISEDGLTHINPRAGQERVYGKVYDTWVSDWRAIGFPENVEERD